MKKYTVNKNCILEGSFLNEGVSIELDDSKAKKYLDAGFIRPISFESIKMTEEEKAEAQAKAEAEAKAAEEAAQAEAKIQAELEAQAKAEAEAKAETKTKANKA